MEYLPGLHQLSIDLNGLLINQWIFVDGERAILIDSGGRTHPDDVIVPYLKGIGLSVGSIASLIITHAHDDHCGGNAAVKRLNSRVEICAHELDVSWIEDHRLQFHELYRVFESHIPNLGQLEAAFFDLIGDEAVVDRPLHGGEILSWGGETSLSIIHTPGHTPGHITVYDAGRRCALVSDAVMGRGLRIGVGSKFWPLYMDVDAYLHTLGVLQGLGVDHLLTGHFEPLAGEEVATFFNDSLEFVHETDQAIEQILHQAASPLPLAEVARKLIDRFPAYQLSVEVFWVCKAHLERWSSQRKVHQGESGWRLC